METSNIKIRKVDIDDASCDESGMNFMLIVDFDNGSTIMTVLDSLAYKPLFDEIVTGQCSGKPETDGERVFWENGASLTIHDMLGILLTEKTARAVP